MSDNSENPFFTLVTYNILAPGYVKPEHYPNVAPEDFAQPGRTERLVAKLEALRADVLCLQEVEYPVFRAIDAALVKHGYRGLWVHKGDQKLDGVATFAGPRAQFSCSLVSVYPDGRHVELKSLHMFNGKRFSVCNTHLKWDDPATPPGEMVGLRQAKAALQTSEFFPPSIICGDFNAELGSPVLQAFAEKGYVDPHKPTDLTFNGGGVGRKIDFTLYRAKDFEVQADSPMCIGNDLPLPNKDEPSDHVPLVARFRLL